MKRGSSLKERRGGERERGLWREEKVSISVGGRGFQQGREVGQRMKRDITV